MAKNTEKYMSKALKKGSKKAKELNTHVFGKKGPTVTHSFESVTSLYKSGKEKDPLYSFTNSGEYKVSLFKLILIAVCAVAGVVILCAAIKSYAEKQLRRKYEDADFEYLCDDDEDMPF